MRIWPIGSFIFFTSLWIISPSIANNKTQTDKVPVHLYMPDGQRSTRLVEVYLSEYINISMRPRLRLMSIAKKEKEPFIMDIDASTDFENEKIWFRPAEVIPGVAWKADEDKEMPKTGTLLLFDVPEEMEEFWRPGLRIRPILTWQSEGDSTWTNKATGRPIYLGNLVPAIIWTVACILLILILLWLLSSSQRYKSPWRSWARYVETKDGSWSLSLAQMAAWTLAVGCVVLHFGLIRLRVPDIPWTLIILMGSSAFTSLYGHYQVRRGAIVYPRQRLHGWKDLVMVVTESGRPMVSMAKGQMIFWTIIAISLFLYKSFWEGVLWDVSVELVGLMGISQAAFLAQEEVELRPREKAMSEAKDRERLQKSKVNP